MAGNANADANANANANADADADADADTVPLPHISDGRRRKGERRRQLLLRATMRVIERHGIAAATQRTVAREADLPPSAVTYHFATVDDLLVATLTAVNDSYIHRVEALPDDPRRALERLAELIATSAGANRTHVVAEYELYLMAARRGDLRAELARWSAAIDALTARYVDDPVRRAGVAAAIDGLFLRGFTADTPPTAAEIHEVLNRLTGQ